MKIFRSPWLYTALFILISAFTTLLNGFYNKLEYWLLQPVPDSQIPNDDGGWVGWYTFVFAFIAPMFIIFFLSKAIINKVAGR